MPTAITRIEPSRRWSLGLRELWQYRELLYFLAWRDVKVRYKQSVLGAGWAILQPVLTMVVFTIFFGGLAKVPSDNIPYPIFVFTALLPWQLFARTLAQCGNSLVDNQSLITKVYFPRLAIPISATAGALVDFGFAFTVLVAMMVYYRVPPTWTILLLPIFLVFAVATALAVGLWLAALNVKYRDVRNLIPFLIQLWLLATPVAYSVSLVPARFQAIYGLNPMAGVVSGFRLALLGRAAGVGPLLLVSAAVVALLLMGGWLYFRRAETSFADVV